MSFALFDPYRIPQLLYVWGSSCMTYWWGFLSTTSLQEVVVLVKPVIADQKGSELLTTPYEGSSAEVVSLSIGIHEASQVLDGKTFRQCRDTSPINDKVFSKLKVIGKTLSAVPAAELKAVVSGLPDSYSTIHVLCGLSPRELVTAVKSKAFSSDLTVRAAKDYLKKVRFPAAVKCRWHRHTGINFGVFQDQEAPLNPVTPASLNSTQGLDHWSGVRLWGPQPWHLRKQDRADREVFWRNALEEELPFSGSPTPTRT